MAKSTWMGYTAISVVALAKVAMANAVLSPWAAPAQGWIATLTSVWVPLIFTCVTIAVLITSRYMGDQDGWISSMLNVMVKASLAGNALAIVTYAVGLGGGGAAAATLDGPTSLFQYVAIDLFMWRQPALLLLCAVLLFLCARVFAIPCPQAQSASRQDSALLPEECGK